MEVYMAVLLGRRGENARFTCLRIEIQIIGTDGAS